MLKNTFIWTFYSRTNLVSIMAFTKIYLTVIKQQISLLKWFLYDYTTLKIQLWHNRKYILKFQLNNVTGLLYF